MLDETVSINPSEKTGDRPTSSSSRKSASQITGSKTRKSRIPTTQNGRNAAQGDAVNPATYEEYPNRASPNNNSARQPTMKTLITPLSNRKPPVATAADKRQLEVQYSSKRTRYANLKKSLADKEKIAQDLYNEMSSLREKIIAAGGKDPGRIEEPRSLQMECFKQRPQTPLETNLPCDSAEQRESASADESAMICVSSLQNQLQDLCDRSREICHWALDRSLSFASLVKSWLTESSRSETVNSSVPLDTEIEAQLMILDRDNEKLRTRLDELATAQKDVVAEFVKRYSDLCCEYDTYRGRVDERPNVDRKDLQEQLNVAAEELKAERDKASQGRDRTRMMELQLQKARGKIRELEVHMAGEEAKAQQLQGNVRSLEVQLKQKEQTMEQRIKEMHKAMKSSENLMTKIEKQRDTFESRMMELREKMAAREAEANAIIKDVSERSETINAEINEERKKRLQAESTLSEMEERCRHLEEKSQLLCDLASEKSNNMTAPDDHHTENEVRLYNDLVVTRAEMEKKQQKIEQLEKEKQEIVAVMHQAASRDDEEQTKDKLAAELVNKTNVLQNLQLEYAALKNVASDAEERNEELERQLSDIQRHLRAKSRESGKAAGLDAIELQQQVSDLRNSLNQVIQQNQELETTLTQKQLELEQRDRVMREQSRFLKVRDELLSILKGKQQANVINSASESYEDMDEVNKQIAAKTEAIQELYATLEGKQLQVMRLEKLVKLLEDQQDRAQAQRTRLEHRIAQLEVSLREKSSNRYVTSKYPRTPRSRCAVGDYGLSHAFSYESPRALLEESIPRVRRSRSSRRRDPRHVSVEEMANLPPNSTDASRCRKPTTSRICDQRGDSSDGEAFVCERCQCETARRFEGDATRGDHPIRKSLYGWLMGSSVLEAFGEPTIRLNELDDKPSWLKEDANCVFGIINPCEIHGRESPHRRRQCRR